MRKSTLALITAVQWLIAESGLDLKEKVSEAGEPPRPSFWGLEKEEGSPDHTAPNRNRYAENWNEAGIGEDMRRVIRPNVKPQSAL